MSVQWLREECPECDTVNWVYNGDPEDLTYPDVEGVKCYACGHQWPLLDLVDLQLMYGEDYVLDCETGAREPR